MMRTGASVEGLSQAMMEKGISIKNDNRDALDDVKVIQTGARDPRPCN